MGWRKGTEAREVEGCHRQPSNILITQISKGTTYEREEGEEEREKKTKRGRRPGLDWHETLFMVDDVVQISYVQLARDVGVVEE